MKKTIYILARSHMDPVWRRCCAQHFRHEGPMVRPYAQIEEAQLRLSIVTASGHIPDLATSFGVRERSFAFSSGSAASAVHTPCRTSVSP